MESVANHNHTNLIMAKLFSLQGENVIGINNYQAKSGEVSNVKVRIGFDVMELKRNDLLILEALPVSKLSEISVEKNIDLEVVKTAFNEMVTAAYKNIDKELENRTIQSQTQTNLYVQFGGNIKVHEEYGTMYVYGLVEEKEVITTGVFKTVKHRAKTIAKQEIGKACNFEMATYRMYKFDNIESFNIEGNNLICN